MHRRPGPTLFVIACVMVGSPPDARACRLTQVSAGWLGSTALREDGTVWWWGEQHPTSLAMRRQGSVTPKQVPGVTDAIAVADGSSAKYWLRADGTVWKVYPYTFEPEQQAQQAGITTAVDIAATAGRLFAILQDTTVVGAGSGSYGELGYGGTTSSSTPRTVRLDATTVLDRVVQVSAGWVHTLFLRDDGTVWACGQNGYGELGTPGGPGVTRTYATLVPGLAGIVEVAAGLDYSLARDGAGASGRSATTSRASSATATTRTSPRRRASERCRP
jgi:hypothetical protein